MTRAHTRPNVVVIYTDQQRFDTIGCLGNPTIRTPHIDRLCAEGTTFLNATTPCPVCMPARWSLHTGQWTSTHRCYSNHLEGPRPDTHLPGLLRSAGYRTGLVGKNHSFLTADDLDVFEHQPRSRHPADDRMRSSWRQEHASRFRRLFEEPAAGGTDGDPEHTKTDAAITFVEESNGQPFFLWLSYLNPHTPYIAPDPWFSMYADAEMPPVHLEPDGLKAAGKPFRQQFHQRNNDAVHPFDARQLDLMRRVYYGMVSLVDAEIGRFMSALADAGVLDDTLVVFLSDHGDYQGDHGLLTKSPALYDCLVRVPMVLRWPGHIPSGRRDRRFASAIDVMPTVLSSAGIDIPPSVEGHDLLPFLVDDGADTPVREAAYAEYGIPGEPYDDVRLAAEGLDSAPITWNGAPSRGEGLPWEGNPVSLAGRIRMARTERWKLVDEAARPAELYDLVDDPYELVNRVNDPEYTPVIESLVELIENRGEAPAR